MQMIKIAALTCAVLLSGCAALENKYTTTAVEDGPRGEPPTEHVAQIKAYLNKALKDPFSAQYGTISEPIPGQQSTFVTTKPATLTNTDVRITENRTVGWLVTAEVNSKNGYGAYDGWKTYKFLFKGNSIVHAEESKK